MLFLVVVVCTGFLVDFGFFFCTEFDCIALPWPASIF
jgi:hypothetical protein